MVQRIRALTWRFRWFVVAACLAGAAAITVAQLRPTPPPTTATLVAARPVAAGQVLTADDVEIIQLLDSLPHTLATDSAIGSTMAIGVAPGTPLIESMIVGPGMAHTAPAGYVVTTLTLADPAFAALIRPGDHIDLYATTEQWGGPAEATMIATEVVVLAEVPQSQDSTWWGTGTSTPGATIIVATTSQSAMAIAGSAGYGAFRAVFSAIT